MRPLRTPVPNDFQPDQASHWLLMTSTCYPRQQVDSSTWSTPRHALSQVDSCRPPVDRCRVDRLTALSNCRPLSTSSCQTVFRARAQGGDLARPAALPHSFQYRTPKKKVYLSSMSSAQQLQKAIANAINHADARTTRLETTTEDLERRICVTEHLGST